MSKGQSLDVIYFDALYSKDADPWAFETSAYEADKYAKTVEALDGRRYGRGLEVGCSIGVLTRALAGAVDDLIAVDISAIPLRSAASRNHDLTNVRFQFGALPRELPSGPFDLIILSEVLYYLSPSDLDAAADGVRQALAPGGDVLMVHWLGDTDYPLTGDEAALQFIAQSQPYLSIIRTQRTQHYRLEVLRSAAEES